MLRHLSLRDFVIVDRLELDFAAGFTALTGETGAGKSILIDALALAVGARGDAAVVREGYERAEIAAEFDVTDLPQVALQLAAQDLDDGAVLLLRRVIDRAGRSRAYVNGRPATVQQLRQLGEALLDIHGQHEHHSLLRPDAQRDLLDAYAGAAGEAAAVADAFAGYNKARQLRRLAEGDAASLAAEREQMLWRVQDLTPVVAEAADWQALNAEQRRLANAAELIDGMRAVAEQLGDADGNALELVATAQTRLSGLVEFDPRLAEVVSCLDVASIQLDEASRGLARIAGGAELDPARLREVESRLDAVLSAARKYRLAPEQLPEALQLATARLAELEQSADGELLRRREEASERAYRGVATVLSKTRAAAASTLGVAVSGAMQDLGMPGGSFAVRLAPQAELSAYGLEQVEYLVTTNAGVSLRGLARVASGGELSRISLALQVILSSRGTVPTLLFDEVDAGVGGAVAETVGQSLRRLGERRQVLCVTHLPQVAAQAHQHWSVSKEHNGDAVSSRVEPLEAIARVEEIARMLGGQAITETTRRHAAEMLQLPIF